MANQPVVKGRATRRGLRSLDGKFYHTRKERATADRAFNKAVKDDEMTEHLPKDIHKGTKPPGGNKDQFDFTFNEKPDKEPASIIIKPKYHCNNCQANVSYGTPICPVCGGRLNWEGLENE